jgi:hypothetical protein
MKIKLWNWLTMHLELIICMFNQKFSNLQTFPLEQQNKIRRTLKLNRWRVDGWKLIHVKTTNFHSFFPLYPSYLFVFLYICLESKCMGIVRMFWMARWCKQQQPTIFFGKVKMLPFISMIYAFWNLYPTPLFGHVRFFFAFSIVD